MRESADCEWLFPDTAGDCDGTTLPVILFTCVCLSVSEGPLHLSVSIRSRLSVHWKHGVRYFDGVICEAFVLTCDEYTRDELPDEFTYVEDLDLAEATVVIRDDDEQFLLQTGMVGHGWFAVPVRVLTAWLTVLPLGVFVGKVALTAERERLLGSAVGAGIVVAIGGFAAP